jgi:hypothetical protein
MEAEFYLRATTGRGIDDRNAGADAGYRRGSWGQKAMK